jgi:glucosamine--fructose-6-phosphate aminotransferase (isomerizing)
LGAVHGSRSIRLMDDLRRHVRPFDADAPIPGAPDPWAYVPMPIPRTGPPWAMAEMIAAEPALASRIVARLVSDGSAAALAAAIRDAASEGATVTVTGCGTSEHAAQGAAEVLRQAWRAAGLPGHGPVAAQAFELAQDPPSTGLVIGVSHEGGTTATIEALDRARAAGARTALVTGSDRSPACRSAGVVLATVELDRSWCHTVGYVSPMIAATVTAALLADRPPGGDRLAARLADGIEAAHAEAVGGSRPDRAIAGRLADARTLVVIGSGADRVAARELVVKVEEAAWLPSAMRDLETFLHGHLPATGVDTGLVLVLTDPVARAARVTRARQALAAAGVVGVRCAAILAADASAAIPAEQTPAGRIVVPEAPALPAPVASLLGTAGPLQLLTLEIAAARGTNPDPILRDDPLDRRAAEVADAPPA